jgi:hypothetical protein
LKTFPWHLFPVKAICAIDWPRDLIVHRDRRYWNIASPSPAYCSSRPAAAHPIQPRSISKVIAIPQLADITIAKSVWADVVRQADARNRVMPNKRTAETKQSRILGEQILSSADTFIRAE